MADYKNVLFCTDFSEDANKAFFFALDLAKKNNARLHILHIPHSPYTYCRHIVDEHVSKTKSGGEAFFDEEVEKSAIMALEKQYGPHLGDFTNYIYKIKVGSPSIEIVRYAKKYSIDIAILGCIGKYEADREIHGSTVENVKKYTHCEVVAIGEGTDNVQLSSMPA